MKAAPMDEAGDRQLAGEPSGMHNRRRAARFRRTATLPPPQPYGSPGESQPTRRAPTGRLGLTVTLWVAGIVVLHVGITDGRVLLPFRAPYRPILVVEAVIVLIAAAIFRATMLRRRVLADMEARGDIPGGTLYGQGPPPSWLPVNEPVELAIAGGYARHVLSPLDDLVLTPSYVVVRHWRSGGPARTIVVPRADITGVMRAHDRSRSWWVLKRVDGAPIILDNRGLVGDRPEPFLPVLRELVRGLEHDGATAVVNRRDAARLALTDMRDRPRVGWRIRFDRRTVLGIVVRLVVLYIMVRLFIGYGFHW